MRKLSFGLIFLIADLLLASCTGGNRSGNTCQGQTGEVNNVILMIGDGMGLTHVTAAMLAQGAPLALQRAQYVGLQTTRSASSDVTDSAAAGTALATGTKTYNGAIGVDSLGQPLVSVLKRAEAAGKATGIVVTCSVTHATPAAFVACNEARNNEDQIAEAYLTTGVDVFIGGGTKFFEQRADGRNLSDEMQGLGYRMLHSLDELKTVDKGNVGVLLAETNLPRMTEGRGDILPEATAEALRILPANSPNGFFLMVEGSQIDYGAHANDSLATVTELIDFDHAVRVAMDFADRHPGTLVVVTADHETGGMALPSDKDRVMNGIALPGNGNRTTATFATKGHSGTMVPIYAYGAGACRFTGLMDNTDIPKRIAELMNLK